MFLRQNRRWGRTYFHDHWEKKVQLVEPCGLLFQRHTDPRDLFLQIQTFLDKLPGLGTAGSRDLSSLQAKFQADLFLFCASSIACLWLQFDPFALSSDPSQEKTSGITHTLSPKGWCCWKVLVSTLSKNKMPKKGALRGSPRPLSNSVCA